MPAELVIELSIRIAATAAIVIGITLAVEKLGPKIGGALAGLPIVIGPAFFFLLREHNVTFSANAAASSLMSLTASQAFLLAYIVTAARSRMAILVATVAWAVCASILSLVPPSPWLALSVFLTAMFAARAGASRFIRPLTSAHVKGTFAMVLVRSTMAGFLVAGVTVASNWLGAVWAGFLMTYPIGLTVISITVHQRSGADMAVATLRAIMAGISSLAAFAFALAILLEPFGPIFAFASALTAGVLVTVVLIFAQSRTTLI